jgi:hypothetical protein
MSGIENGVIIFGISYFFIEFDCFFGEFGAEWEIVVGFHDMINIEL